MIRGPSHSTFEIFDVAKGQKRPFAVLTFESSQNFILTYFQKLMWFYLLAAKDSLLGKSLRENFFSDANALDRSYRDRHLILSITLGKYFVI